MISYPKIETLYERDERSFKVMTGRLRLREFGNIQQWVVTEKVDGSNVRIGWRDDGTITFGGRTDNAQMPVQLSEYLRQTFTPDTLNKVFADAAEVMLFGEGYGAKIQSGGSYRADVSFRLFDVLVGSWWLERDNILEVATKLGGLVVPYLGEITDLPQSAGDLEQIIGDGGRSLVASQDNGPGRRAEGIVARTSPMLFTRKGERLMWKLKFRDFI